MQYLGKNSISTEEYINGLLAGDPRILSKALSLVESSLESDKTQSQEVLEAILPKTGNSIRIGITGAPGVGKSTFIEALGLYLVDNKHKVAVLTVDPSSRQSQGSILGDKTRMDQLSRSDNAYIRPSAAGTTLGGVAHHTRESILLCESAGYDVVLVETVGVGQSESLVSDIVDFFLLLMIAGAGDELQGIKKGIIEMADALVITKADGENLSRAKKTQSIFKNALHLLTGTKDNWQPPTLTCSSRENVGIDAIWKVITDYRDLMEKNGFLEAQRQQQRVRWLQECIKLGIENHLEQHPAGVRMDQLAELVKEGKLHPSKAAASVLEGLVK